MPEFCSCGAELPPDARFCHKCGKPQRPEYAAAEEPEPKPEPEPIAEPEPVAPPPPAAVNFHNPIAVRVGFSMAGIAALLSWLPFLNLGMFLWWLGAGFLSVPYYRKRTGQALTVRGGLQLGWITGILTFVITIVLFTVSIVPVAMSPGGLGAMFQQALSRSVPANDPNMQQALRMVQTPEGVATILLLMVFLFFVMITVLCTLGGALGAKVSGRQSQA